MTVLEDVQSFLVTISPAAACDDCIADELGLSVRQHANHKTRELECKPGFVRRKDICSICSGDKKVIRYAV